MVFWCTQGMAFMPSLLVIWSSTAFIVPYLISVLTGHVAAFVPYISDTGTNPPESGVFGFMISVTAMLGAATMYTRYKILDKLNSSYGLINAWFNTMSLLIGLLGCIGMGIVATFQEKAVPIVHDVGALITFICGVVYILLQSIISYKSCPQWNRSYVCHVRMAISIVSVIAVFPMIICASLIRKPKYDWNPSDEDYAYHLTSAICEWIVAFGFVTFFLTYIKDFQGASLIISTEIYDDYVLQS
ncbi:DNA damage-regulated autophagy modulator protein 1 isoform X2 [Spea bombifrons]|uniref:DNA damage-regulated autophagy modulator protein 1 isoform X2 n=1 Tax=Spea bombifrons TaxID=233779 RepID=UPI002349D632|nr:DNA damage-regulated autophagy modulator protein 1 isoform X2 [Spea bombifrons]